MKLSTKILITPVGLAVTVFLAIGLIIFLQIVSNSQKMQQSELKKLVKSEEKQLRTGLSLVTSSSLAADAIFGLEADDDALAVELVENVNSLGLDAVYVTDLNGKLLYPKEGKIPPGMVQMLSQSTPKADAPRVITVDGHMV